ncbi:hypothetical protein CK203_061361 [Vitis vinifera]|uniref:Uncharacterized protein n=1 Tax=Vitis vinifera TaxID=29760 RepID=A0A438GAS3_VITVI|nr:hypothetical protein CK203_061361 [Vitis vinifera]
MLGAQTNQPITECSALAARGPPNPSNNNQPRKIRPWCDHCQKPGHTKDTCWKIHGKPANWKSSCPQNDKESLGHHVTVEDNPVPPNSNLFNKEQLELLQKIFNQPQKWQIPSILSSDPDP